MPGFRPKEALKAAQTAEKTNQPRVASHHYAMLSIYLRKKGKYREAGILIAKAIALSPKSARLYLQQALCEIQLGNELAAAGGVDLFARNTIRRGKVEAYTPYLELQLESYPKLRSLFYEAILKIEKTGALAFLGLAKAKVQEKKFPEALRILADAWKTNDRRAEVSARFKELLKSQRHTAALEDLEKVEAGILEFEDFELRWVGSVKKKKAESKSEFKKDPPLLCVEEKEKGLRELIQELENELGFEVEDREGNLKPVVREFREKAGEIIGQDSQARMDLALAFYEMGLYRDGKSELEHIAVEDVAFLESRCLLGEILVAEGAELAATEVFQAVLRDSRCTTNQGLHCRYFLSRIFLRLGEFQRSLDYILEIESLDPQFREVRKLKQEVTKQLETTFLRKVS